MNTEQNDWEKHIDYKLMEYPDAYILISDYKIIFCNHSACRLMGYDSMDEIIGLNFVEVFLNSDELLRKIEELLAGEENSLIGCWDIGRRDGTTFKSDILLMKNKDKIALILKDKTETDTIIDRLNVFYKVLEKNSEGILLINLHEEIIWANESFSQMTGFEQEEIIGKDIHFIFNSFNMKTIELIKDNILKTGEFNGETSLTHKDGKRLIVDANIVTIHDENGRLSYIAASCKDITENKKQEQKIYELAYKDHLTGLNNRTYFMEYIQFELEKAKNNNQKIAVLYFDLDNFKSINDTLGHKIGDKVLTIFGQTLEKTVSELGTVARLGGDEFVCLLPNIENEMDVIKVTDKLSDAFKNTISINGNEFFISSSIGISIFPDDTSDAEELMHNADIAMYKAKKNQENKVVRFTNKMREDLDEHFKLSNHLRKAIEKNELLIHYQPIVNINTGEVISAEALLRWNHSLYGYIPPAKFIPIAESNGLIIDIGEWVINEVCKQNIRWQNEGHKKIPIAVNISVKQLEEDMFSQKVIKILEETGLSPEFLELEITESISMNNVDKIIRALEDFKAHEIKISIDDFGTGYSSLGKLKKLSINKLKIDRSFIHDLNGSQETEIVSAIIALANSLGLHIIAEGIETIEQLDFLQSKECQLGQGYYFSKPLDTSTFEKVLSSNR